MSASKVRCPCCFCDVRVRGSGSKAKFAVRDKSGLERWMRRDASNRCSGSDYFVAPILLAYDEEGNSVRKTSRDLDKQVLEIAQRWSDELAEAPEQNKKAIDLLKKIMGKDSEK